MVRVQKLSISQLISGILQLRAFGEKLGESSWVEEDLVRILNARLFNQLIKTTLRSSMSYFVLKQDGGGNEKGPTTTLIHKSGINMLLIDDQTNEISWVENDVVSNSLQTQSQSTTKKTQIPSGDDLAGGTPGQELNAFDVESLLSVPNEVYNIGNNDMSVSNKLFKKVQATILSVEVLSEIISSILTNK